MLTSIIRLGTKRLEGCSLYQSNNPCPEYLRVSIRRKEREVSHTGNLDPEEYKGRSSALDPFVVLEGSLLELAQA